MHIVQYSICKFCQVDPIGSNSLRGTRALHCTLCIVHPINPLFVQPAENNCEDEQLCNYSDWESMLNVHEIKPT